MRYVVSGRLREPCGLSPAEYFTLAVREWEMVLGWMAAGKALGYGRLSGAGGGAILVDVASEAEARMLAGALPFAPYAEVSVVRAHADGPLGRDPNALLGRVRPTGMSILPRSAQVGDPVDAAGVQGP